MKRTLVFTIALLVPASFALAAAGKTTHAHATAHAGIAAHEMVPSGDAVKWGDAPPVLPSGAQMSVLDGNPGGAGSYTLRLKFPDGYKIMPHMHPTMEHVTVINGTFNVGMGKTFSEEGGKAMAAGGFGTMPAKMAHFAWTTGETVIQIQGMGPFAMTYVNPADDPSKKK
jgi:hypothetical protein